MYSNKKWEIDFAGVLANDGEVSTGRNTIILNRNNNLQFYIRLISTPPKNFPRQVKDVCGYTDDLSNFSFYDDKTLPENERKEALRNFLDRYILIFHIELKKRDGIKEYHIARNIRVVRKNDSFRPNTILEPVPVFSEETTNRTKNVFEQQLYSRKYIGDNKQVSKDDDDTPSIILWKDSQENDAYTLYGWFEKHENALGGFKFHPFNNQVKWLPLNVNYIFESYTHEELLFMDSNLHEELQEVLEENGEPLIREEEPIKGEQSYSYGYSKMEQVTKDEELESVDKEKEFMDSFVTECKIMGLYYDTKDLYNFHTAMKTGSLVILAGMSGTGKSKLVQAYTRALKLSKDQSKLIPVRPFWKDDADVIGYLDTLNNVYRPGDSGLMSTLIRANEYEDDLHIVCFDEMNLARVEHYFSQFLSILETDDKHDMQLYDEEYGAKIYNQHIFPSSLTIGKNVIFVGTVNLDETTYPFSDKVLDRANVITLNMRPYNEILKMEEERLEELSKLNKQTKKEESTTTNKRKNSVTFDIYSSFKSKEQKISLLTEESTFLWELDKALKGCNRNIGVGWRILRQISVFLNNLPKDSPLSREEAFDIQLVQRILTKIRGSEEQFMELLGRYNLDTKEVEDSKFLELLSEMPMAYKFTQAKNLIKEKAKELRLHGHTI
ncbi:AAA domain (dynein-related subfamily) [Priestia megaterium Q3]|uniref:AAA domain (Dynein-related subfamily) n=1 Tax=Priestia megaterium Q3 TaxID=1452722 RepID=A0A806U932_PRIMG|nr:AAA family ATPase [Priestia megaterium]AKP77175.1 AAA domain (dynein-related subfamily) [Priestia megaterium Q3]